MLALLITMLTLYTTDPGTKDLRRYYFDAATSAEHLPAFKQRLDRYGAKDHYYFCYTAAYNSLESRYAQGLGKKMKYFNQCKEDLAQSLELKDSFDARFIRFCIQYNTPAILGYKSHLEADKKHILQNLRHQDDKAYKANVKAFLKQCSLLSATEKSEAEKI